MSLAFISATGPDLLRLLALPVFAWTAVRDIKTRRVSSTVWIPLTVLGAILLVWDGWLAWHAGPIGWSNQFVYEFVVPAAVSLGLVVPIAYLFWWFGGFGGADAKALLVLALLFPTLPSYAIGSWTVPLVETPIGTFSFTILTNAVIVALAIPLLLAVRNAASGRIRREMFLGWPIAWERLPETPGWLMEEPNGTTSRGLDLDALRMYLRWRGCTLEELRADPEYYRDPATLPAEPNPPTDGAVAVEPDGGVAGSEPESVDGDTAESKSPEATEDVPSETTTDDPWGADAFLKDIEGTAYGTTPEQLRAGLDTITSKETVWVSPGTPFLVPIFLGMLLAVLYGDLLFGVLGIL
ncbi:peptidase A24A prepilin type IV [Natrialba chahannaoensis JCM 10990]|uniref:Peptidase A24A prepilin type IV n=1 Tax=Natrialba chahannaoensis JCM 10990 TaxID=1227492 RepID=M0AYG1_9EURY|nr:A24 family peptidase C-terminal domain-containing protein [Natrialba chahannaoensis]ELZ02993.1 peptidase A24A prepilin type IV [Natrialba chahannaoensis JCM 10990]